MFIYKLPECVPSEAVPEEAVLCLGNFDGVHRGHMRLIEEAKKYAYLHNTKSAVWTFFSPTYENARVITADKEKLMLFKNAGLDYAIFNSFPDIKDIAAESFLQTLIISKFHCKAVVCGFNFRFGKDRLGDPSYLEKYLSAYNIKTIVVPPVKNQGQVISSTSIRDFIEKGDMEKAELYLGRPFFISFPVVHGQKIGSRIGIPTLNQNLPVGHIIPKTGVYACSCEVEGTLYPAVTNVGKRPTVNGTSLNCETHIIGFNGDLYGKDMMVNFHLRLRDEKKFETLEKLRLAIERDIQQCTLIYNNKIAQKK